MRRLAGLFICVAATAGAQPLKLDEAVAKALTGHPRLQVRDAERTEVSARALALARRASPTLGAALSQGGATEPIYGPSYSVYTPYDRGTMFTTLLNLGLRGQLPWFGTTYSLGVEAQRVSSDRIDQPLATMVQLKPFAEIRQPLLRNGFGMDYRLAQQSLRDALSVADQQLLVEAQALVLQVVESYWAAARAARQIEIRRRAKENAEQSLKATEALLAAGRLSGEALLASRADVARRAEDVTDAELRATRSVAPLRALLREDTESGEPMTYQLDEAPLPNDAVIAPGDLKPLIAALIEGNPTLRAARAAQQSAATDLQLAQRALLPDLSVNLKGALVGIGGQSACPSGFLRDGISTCAIAPAIAQGPVSGALTTLSRGTYNSWEAGLSFEAPLDNAPAYEAIAAAQRRQTVAAAERELQRSRLVAELYTRVRELELSHQRAELAARSTELAQQAHAALQQRFKLGGATIFDLNRSLDALVLAEDAANSASIDLTIAQLRFEELEPGALLKRYRVQLDGAPVR